MIRFVLALIILIGTAGSLEADPSFTLYEALSYSGLSLFLLVWAMAKPSHSLKSLLNS